MDQYAFKQFKEELLAAIESDQKLQRFHVQIERLLSHVESEQRVTVNHGREIEELKGAVFDTNETIGIRTWRRETDRYLGELRWVIRACAGSLIILVIKAGWELLTKHT